MTGLPVIVPHQCRTLTSADLDTANEVASKLVRTRPELRINPLFEDLAADKITDATSFHVDDLKGIQYSSPSHIFIQERARLRATDGDVIATSLPEVPGYETYCRDTLKLGRVTWLCPTPLENPLSLAEACWVDRAVRSKLVHQIRQNDLRYLHPHMGTEAIWELALLLHQTSHRDVKVIGPPPQVAEFANNKGSFTQLVQSLFGQRMTPRTFVVWNTAAAAKRIRELDEETRTIAIKLPSSVGGQGILLLHMTEKREKSLAELEHLLIERVQAIGYQVGDELLVSSWVEDLVASPSAQLWLPPLGEGLPVFEGLFEQIFSDRSVHFTGFERTSPPQKLCEQVTRCCLMLARVFQLLGYVGRCSFDMLFVGSDIDDCRMEFVECNGRWGGTSLPMTLMNQLFSDWARQPFINRTLKLDGVGQTTFSELVSELSDHLYDTQTSLPGKIVLYNPQRTIQTDEVSVIALLENWCEGSEAMSVHEQQIADAVQRILRLKMP